MNVQSQDILTLNVKRKKKGSTKTKIKASTVIVIK